MRKIFPALFAIICLSPNLCAYQADVQATIRILDARFCWSDDLVDQLQLTVQITLMNAGSEVVNVPTNLVVQRVIIAKSSEDLAQENYVSNLGWTTFGATPGDGPAKIDLFPLRYEPRVLNRQFAPLISKSVNLSGLKSPARIVLILGLPEMPIGTVLPSVPYLKAIRTRDAELTLDVKQDGIQCPGTK